MPQKLADYKISNFSVLIVGEPKTGKTRVASAFPSPYFLDFDRNMRSVLTADKTMADKILFDSPYLDEKGERVKDEDVWGNAMGQLAVATNMPAVKTIVIDSLSSLMQPLFQHIFKLVKKQEGKVIDKMRVQDYGALKVHLELLVQTLFDTNKTVVVLSHQKTEKDEDTGVIRYCLNIPGQSKDNFGALFNDIWATEGKRTHKGVEYNLLTKPTRRHISLGSSLNLPDVFNITDKTPTQIWDMLKGPTGL